MKISLIEFSTENFKIFKNKVTFSPLARKSEHTFDSNGENLLKTSLIYGPNASGKSTLLQALVSLWGGITKSANNPEGSSLPYQPFILSSQKDIPVFFEIVFSLDKKIFKYNFSFLQNEIVTENLSEILASGTEKKYLVRKRQDIKVFADFEKSKDVAEIKTRKEVLFLSAASQWNNELAMQTVDGFKKINVINGLDSGNYRGYTMHLCKEDESKKKILDLLQTADFSINDIEVKKMLLPEPIIKQMSIMGAKEIPDKVDTVFFIHNKFNSKGDKIGTAKFNFGDESTGTRRFFDMLGPIVDTLENGNVLFIDEFDNSIHPYLTKFIIDLFEKNNPKNAQLIVTAHDTSLLSHKELNKEQFWFTEKDKFGAGNLFSLAEFKTQRNDTEFSKKYLEGRFGAIPFIDLEN
ncbi:MAG TPA: ATP-binding protein [Ignavibacteria bacterium]|nr:ATP-binding protein [Ignavibacteria bacterium]